MYIRYYTHIPLDTLTLAHAYTQLTRSFTLDSVICVLFFFLFLIFGCWFVWRSVLRKAFIFCALCICWHICFPHFYGIFFLLLQIIIIGFVVCACAAFSRSFLAPVLLLDFVFLALISIKHITTEFTLEKTSLSVSVTACFCMRRFILLLSTISSLALSLSLSLSFCLSMCLCFVLFLQSKLPNQK